MKKISALEKLREAIFQLEQEKAEAGKLLKEEFHEATESLKPINLIKNGFKEVTQSKQIKNQLINASAGLIAGFIFKKLFQGMSRGPFKKLLGTAIMFGVTSLVATHPETVKSWIKKGTEVVRKKPALRIN